MASGPRSAARPGGAPGRAPGRARTSGRTGSRTGQPRTSSGSGVPAAPAPGTPLPSRGASSGVPRSDRSATGAERRAGRISVTGRAVALGVVLLLLTISYASSLRIYLSQKEGIAQTRAVISERQARIDSLQTSLALWQDPDYVRTQARERLGWVVPGEIGFRVVDADGNPLGGGAEIEGAAPAKAAEAAWWSKVWGGVAAADAPEPAKPAGEKKPTVTVKTKPGG